MKKIDLLAQIESQTKGIAKVEQTMADKGVPEVITMENGKIVRKYTVNVAVTEGDTVNFKNIPIVVFNEGLVDEDAVLAQGYEPPRIKDFETKAKNYLDGQVNDNIFLSFKIAEVSEEFKYAIATVIENVAGVMTRKNVVVYKPAAKPITHAPFVVAS